MRVKCKNTLCSRISDENATVLPWWERCQDAALTQWGAGVTSESLEPVLGRSVFWPKAVESSFPCILINTIYYYALNFCHSDSWKWCFIVVLIILIVSEMMHLFIIYIYPFFPVSCSYLMHIKIWVDCIYFYL